MDVSFNNVVESTRQYFQGVPTPGGGSNQGGPVYPSSPSFWTAPPFQLKQQQHQQFAREAPSEHHNTQQQQQQHPTQHPNPRLPSLSSFSLAYRGSGGTLPSMSSLKGGFDAASVPPRHPGPSGAYASYFQQHGSRDQQQAQLHQQQSQQPLVSQHPPHHLINQKQSIQNHAQPLQTQLQSTQNQRSTIQQAPPSNHQALQNHQNHQQNQSVINQANHQQSSSTQPQQPPHQNQQNTLTHQQKAFHDSHQTMQNHALMFQMQQSHKQSAQNHKMPQQLIQNHQALQSSSQQHQYQSHQQSLQNHHAQMQSSAAAMTKYQSHHQGLTNMQPSHHGTHPNHVNQHPHVINHLPNSQQQSSHQQSSHQQSSHQQSSHQQSSHQQSSHQQSSHQQSNHQQSSHQQSSHQQSSHPSGHSQSPLTRQSPHQANSQANLTRQSPHLPHHQNLPSPSMHLSNHQSGFTRQSPLLASHQQVLTRHSPHMPPHQPPNMPSPTSHMSHQSSIPRHSPIALNHHQGLPSPSSHLSSAHTPQNYSSQQSASHSQNLFTAPTTPISGSRTTPQSTPNATPSSSLMNQVKRESPLDLSVKTIRQSADSTADPEHVYYTFHNEFIRGKASGSGLSQQTPQRTSLPASSRAAEYQFPSSAPPVATVEAKKSKEPYYQLPSVNSFNKNYYKDYQQPHQNQHPQQLPPQQHNAQPQLPRMAYPPDSKYPPNYLKRPSEPEKPAASSKIARVDNWKQTIDQQIEKRFNSYLSSIAINGEKKPSLPIGSNMFGQEHKQNGADKRVLSILRNSLETREARNQQVQQQKPVTPKYEARIPNVPLRQNLPPFGAFNLDRTTAAPFGRLHIPRAMDSFSSVPQASSVQDVVDITDDDEAQAPSLLQLQGLQPQAPLQPHQPPTKGELDGLAAFLAARIRTKAELKQVSTKESTKSLTPTPASSGGDQSSPRSTPIFSSAYENKDLVKSFTTQESPSINGNGNKNLTWSLASHRISKENSLLASLSRRRDSDSEGAEIPLSDLRRGSHSSVPSLPSGPPPPPIEISPEEEEEFKKWIAMCEEFMVQLKDCKCMRKKIKLRLDDGTYIKEEKEDDYYYSEMDRLLNDEKIDSDGENGQVLLPPKEPEPMSTVSKKRQPKKSVPRKKKLKVVNRGWQEEVWNFKRSLQEGSSRPSGWPRAPGSLPDLERLSNPPQELPSEPDGDKKSISKALSKEKTFLDQRMQRYSARKKKLKKFIEKNPRPSSSELLPTPKSAERDPKKETIAGFRDDLPAEGDLPPDLKPKNKDIKIRIKGIYELERERPASAPPPGMTKEELRRNSALRKSRLIKKKKGVLVKKGEVPRLIPEKKFKTFRRKLKSSSGFDYIRKKKKQTVKKEGDAPPREKKKKTAPMTEPEIQAEIKGWVLNKGIGETLLHRATKVGNVDVVHYCLEKLHHNPAPRDNAGYTPLHVACSRGHLQVASLLLKYGANVSDSALGGVRPLHEAAENSFTKLVKLLLEHGADPQLATYSGSTALSLATDEDAKHLMEVHIANRAPLVLQQEEAIPSCSHADELLDGDSNMDIDGFEIEESEILLPSLYRLLNEPRNDSWVLFHELAPLLRVKTKEALLKQLGQEAKAVFRDMKLSEFYEKANCRSIAGSVGLKTPKLTLVKYTDTIKFLLGVDTTIIPR